MELYVGPLPLCACCAAPCPVKTLYEYFEQQRATQVLRYECLVCLPYNYAPVSGALRTQGSPWTALSLELWDGDGWVSSSTSLAQLVANATEAQQCPLPPGVVELPIGSNGWVSAFLDEQQWRPRPDNLPQATRKCPHLWKWHGHDPAAPELRSFSAWQNLAAFLDSAGWLQGPRYLAQWPNELVSRSGGSPVSQPVNLRAYLTHEATGGQPKVALSWPQHTAFDLQTGEFSDQYPKRTPEVEQRAHEFYDQWLATTDDPLRDSVLNAAARELYRGSSVTDILIAHSWASSVLLDDPVSRGVAFELLTSEDRDLALVSTDLARDITNYAVVPQAETRPDEILPVSEWQYWSPGSNWFA